MAPDTRTLDVSSGALRLQSQVLPPLLSGHQHSALPTVTFVNIYQLLAPGWKDKCDQKQIWSDEGRKPILGSRARCRPINKGKLPEGRAGLPRSRSGPGERRMGSAAVGRGAVTDRDDAGGLRAAFWGLGRPLSTGERLPSDPGK